ncbi:MAG: efflux RND transporter periplasmic adaptor subunit [Treponema sp.]|jgi:multidrug efflux pump subunit AcrA (membrane-fusion protein)|nr:efflux RND transporter periplasmic adaptor subunit [Treponema sp.]
MRARISQNKKILIWCAGILLLLTVLIFSGCKKEKTEEKVEMVFAVNTAVSVRGQIDDYISVSGDIYAGSTVDIHSEAAGVVAEIFVSVGQRVNRGDSIIAVDPSRPGMRYLNSIARTPISGTVIAIPAQIGMTINQAVPLVRLSGGGGLEIRLYVAERFISKMAMNLPCEITLAAWPGDVFYGRVNELSPTVDLASRTMEVRVTVTNTGSKLKAGMFAKVRIITERKNNVVKIPTSAMLSRFGEQYVYVVEKDSENPEQSVVRKRIVVPGINIDGMLEIQSGLEADEEVVTKGQTLLNDGVRVNVIERHAPAEEN